MCDCALFTSLTFLLHLQRWNKLSGLISQNNWTPLKPSSGAGRVCDAAVTLFIFVWRHIWFTNCASFASRRVQSDWTLWNRRALGMSSQIGSWGEMGRGTERNTLQLWLHYNVIVFQQCSVFNCLNCYASTRMRKPNRTICHKKQKNLPV